MVMAGCLRDIAGHCWPHKPTGPPHPALLGSRPVSRGAAEGCASEVLVPALPVSDGAVILEGPEWAVSWGLRASTGASSGGAFLRPSALRPRQVVNLSSLGHPGCREVTASAVSLAIWLGGMS